MSKANCDSAKSPKWGVETLAVKSVAGVLTPDHGLCVLHTVHAGRVHAGVTTTPVHIFNPEAGGPLLPVDTVPSVSPVSSYAFLPYPAPSE